MAWDMAQVQVVLDAGGDHYRVRERLERLTDGDADLGNLLWALWRNGQLHAQHDRRWWYPMSRADALRSEDLLALVKAAPVGQKTNLWPGWCTDLNYMLDALSEPGALAGGLAALTGDARDGLALALHRHGWLDEGALGGDALDRAARGYAGGSLLTKDHYRGFERRFGVERWRAAICRHAADPALDIHGILHLKPLLDAATDAQLLTIASKAWLHQDLSLLLDQLDARAATILPSAVALAEALPGGPEGDALANLLACWLPTALAEAGLPFPSGIGRLLRRGAAHGEGDASRGPRMDASARALPAAVVERVAARQLKARYPSDICWVLVGACPTPELTRAAVALVTAQPRRAHTRDAEVNALTAWGPAGLQALALGYRSRCPQRVTFALAAAGMRREQAAPLLAEMLTDTTSDVVEAARGGLIALGDAGITAVTPLCRSRKKAHRLGAARVLAAHPSSPEAATLAAAMLDKEKVAAVRAALAPFVRGAPSPRPDEALDALRARAGAHVDALSRLFVDARYHPERASDWRQWEALGLPLLAGLLIGAEDHYCGPEAARIWWEAVDAVGDTGDTGDTGAGALAPWLCVGFVQELARGHTAEGVRQLLQRFGDDALAPLLWALEEAPRRDQRSWILEGFPAVAEHGSNAALAALVGLLGARPTATARAATSALTGAGPAALPLVLPHLTGGSADVRARAAAVVGGVGDAAALPALEAALAGERSVRVKEALGAAVFTCRPPPEAPADGDDATSDAALDASLASQPGVTLPRWLDIATLPPLRWSSGAALSPGAVGWLLHRMSKETHALADPDLPAAMARVGAEGRADVYDALLQQTKTKGPKARPRWLTFCRAWLLDEERLEAMARGLDTLASSSFKLAEYGLLVLKRSGAAVGVRWLDHWSRKARRGSVRDRARGMLDALAAAQGVTRAEVAERAIPDLGFDDAGRQPFPYSTRTLTLVLTPGNEVALEAEDGRRLKSAPAARKGEDPAVIKARRKALADLKKEIRVNTRAQVERLELAMSGRSWSTEAWRALFLEHPFIFSLGRTCLWETGDRRFYVSEEKELLDSDYETVIPGERVRLAHPVSLSAAELATWQAVFADGDLVQPFEQLARRVFPRPAEGEAPIRDLLLTGRSANAIALFHGLHKHAFERGSTGDGGAMEDASRRFEGGWRATLSLDGLGVSAGWHSLDDTAAVNDLSFRQGETQRPAPEVPERVYTEAMLALHQLLGL